MKEKDEEKKREGSRTASEKREKKKRVSGGRFSSAVIPAAAGGGLLLLVSETLLFMRGASPLQTGITLLVTYVCFLLLLVLLRFFLPGRKKRESEELFISSGGMAVLQRLPSPVAICRENGSLLWVNPALSSLSGGQLRSGAGQNLASSLKEAGALLSGGGDGAANGARGLDVRLYGSAFTAYAYGVSVRGEKLLAILFESREELLALRAEKKKCNPLVCYIMIDNLDDVLRMSGSGAHRLLAAIGEEMNRFAEELHGILQEVEKDKYLILFSEDRLAGLLAERFAILDRIAAIRTGDKNPVTVTASIGVGRTEGTLSEKEESAQAALNYALQDGGACAMVRGAGRDYVKYGGNLKAVQSSSKVRSRTEGEHLIREIDRSDRVLIMGHKNADYDCFASCIGAARLALSRGVPTYVVLESDNYNISRAIPGVMTVPEMQEIFLDAAEAQEKLTSDTLVIVTDVNNPALLAAPSLENCAERVAYVDHHRKTVEFRHPPVLAYIDSNASSASELMSEMLEACLPKGMLSVAEAELLLSGIILDTKNFTVGAGPRTFGAAQYLKSIGANPARVQAELFSPDMDSLRRQSAFESGAEVLQGRDRDRRQPGRGDRQKRGFHRRQGSRPPAHRAGRGGVLRPLPHRQHRAREGAFGGQDQRAGDHEGAGRRRSFRSGGAQHGRNGA